MSIQQFQQNSQEKRHETPSSPVGHSLAIPKSQLTNLLTFEKAPVQSFNRRGYRPRQSRIIGVMHSR
jgi:hypothetical protein